MNAIAECEFCKQEKVISARGWCRTCYSRWQKTGSLEYQRKGIRNICEVDGCEKYVVSHGLCDKHRLRLAHHGHLESTRPNDWGKREKHPLYSVWIGKKRFCDRQLCKKWRDDFWVFVKDVGERPSKHHYLRAMDDDVELNPSNCHWVESLPHKTNSEERKRYASGWAKEDRRRNPRKYKNTELLKSFGITIETYEQMQKAQGNKCAICREEEKALNPQTKKPRGLAVDHCHDSGKVRGLLCTDCNRGLGAFKDNVGLLKKAILYLKSNTGGKDAAASK